MIRIDPFIINRVTLGLSNNRVCVYSGSVNAGLDGPCKRSPTKTKQINCMALFNSTILTRSGTVCKHLYP